MNMKKYLILTLIIVSLFNFCNAQNKNTRKNVKNIGSINMISTRNIGNLSDYELLASYARGNQKKITKSKARTIPDAIDQTIREVPGGVFLMNATCYLVKGKYFVIEGDVWGLKQNANYKGFSVGDKVMWKTTTGYKKGTIEASKDSESCVVIDDETQKRQTIKYVKLMRVGDSNKGGDEQ